MTQFLVEVYVSGGDPEGMARTAARAGEAARELARGGLAIRHVDSIHVPEDETCFLLFDAPSEGVVRAAAGWAQLTCNRVVEARGAYVEEDQR